VAPGRAFAGEATTRFGYGTALPAPKDISREITVESAFERVTDLLEPRALSALSLEGLFQPADTPTQCLVKPPSLPSMDLVGRPLK